MTSRGAELPDRQAATRPGPLPSLSAATVQPAPLRAVRSHSAHLPAMPVCSGPLPAQPCDPACHRPLGLVSWCVTATPHGTRAGARRPGFRAQSRGFIPALPGAEVSEASAREAVPAAVGEKASSQGSSSRKSPWAGGGEPQEGPGWSLPSGRPPPGAPCLAGPSRAWVASRFIFIFNSLYCSNHLRATENKLLSSADLSSLASIVCHLLILASDHFHPHPPPKGRHTPRIAPRRGAVSAARVPTAIWPQAGVAGVCSRTPRSSWWGSCTHRAWM